MIHDILETTLVKVALTFFLVGHEINGTPYGHEDPRWYSQKTGSRSKFVFPSNNKSGQLQGQLYGDELYTIPVPSCQNTTFCEKPSYYPDDLVNLVVEEDNTYKYSAKVDEIPKTNMRSKTDLSREMPICESTVQVVFPKTAESWDKRWLFVINHSKFRQGVRIEACGNENNRTSSKLPDDFKPTCKQLYSYRRLATILPNGTIKLEALRFPSGCRGYIKLSDLHNKIAQSDRKVFQI